MFDEFVAALQSADAVIIAPFYAAREQNVYGVTSQTLSERLGEHALYCGSMESTAAAIKAEAREGDLVIVMGAGDVFHVFDLLKLDKN